MTQDVIDNGEKASTKKNVLKFGGILEISDRNSQNSTANLWFLLFSTFAASLGPFMFGYSIGFTSPTLKNLASDLGLTSTGKSIFSSIVSIGAMVGAIYGGNLADVYGRKVPLSLAAVLFSIGWGIISNGEGLVQICTGRFITGVGTGIVSFAVPVYIAEISPGHLRGRLGAVNQFAIAFGIFFVYLVGMFCDWRTLALIGIYPAVILLFSLLVMPETPRWIAKRRSEEELVESLHYLRGKAEDISKELSEIKEAVAQNALLPKASWRDFLDADLRQPLIAGIGLLGLQQFSGVNAIMFFAGTIFTSAGFTDSNAPGVAIQGVQVLLAVIAVGIMDKAGRRTFLTISASFMAIGCFILALSFKVEVFESTTNLSEFLAVLGILVFVIAFSIGVGPVPWVVMSEIFPAHIRDMAGSIAVLVSWISCFIVTLTFQDLLDWNSIFAFSLYGVLCLSIVLFVQILLPETKGKSLEEIEAIFKTKIQDERPEIV